MERSYDGRGSGLGLEHSVRKMTMHAELSVWTALREAYGVVRSIKSPRDARGMPAEAKRDERDATRAAD